MLGSIVKPSPILIIAQRHSKKEIGHGTLLSFALTTHRFMISFSNVTHVVKRQQVSDALFSLPGYLRGLEGFNEAACWPKVSIKKSLTQKKVSSIHCIFLFKVYDIQFSSSLSWKLFQFLTRCISLGNPWITVQLYFMDLGADRWKSAVLDLRSG